MTDNRRLAVEEELCHEIKDMLSLNIKIRGRLERARNDNNNMQGHMSRAATLAQQLVGMEEGDE